MELNTKPIDTIIFDLGGVLIDWKPEYVYLDAFNGDREKMRWFLDNVCTFDWNENQDAGYSLQKATEERIALFPDYEHFIRMFYGQWETMLGAANLGTVAILEQLTKHPSYRVVALTNWSAETFPIALERFEFLQWFEEILVSGAEKTRKPFPEIYEIALQRFHIDAEHALFIDDNLRNIKAAETLGIRGIHFETSAQLEKALKLHAIDL